MKTINSAVSIALNLTKNAILNSCHGNSLVWGKLHNPIFLKGCGISDKVEKNLLDKIPSKKVNDET